MKYETPELTALTSAINAIQTAGTDKEPGHPADSNAGGALNDKSTAYADWE